MNIISKATGAARQPLKGSVFDLVTAETFEFWALPAELRVGAQQRGAALLQPLIPSSVCLLSAAGR